MNNTRYEMLKEIEEIYEIEIVKTPLMHKFNIKAYRKADGQLVPKYFHSKRPNYKPRFSFYLKKIQKSFDYYAEELIAYKLGLNVLDVKITKKFTDEIIKPKLREVLLCKN